MQNNIVIVDFETGGLNPLEHEAISIGAKAYNGRTLEPYGEYGGDGEFYSLMKPLDFDKLTPGAMNVNKIPISDLKKAPEQELVWKQFGNWMKQWNPKSGAKTAPIWGGKNCPFDKGFSDALDKKWYVDKGKKPPVLFNGRMVLDFDQIFFLWHEDESDPPNHKMDTLREWFGLKTDGAHDAIVDCRQTGALIMRYLNLHRTLQKQTTREGKKAIQFKGSFIGMGI